VVCFVYIYILTFDARGLKAIFAFGKGIENDSNAWLFLVHISCHHYLSTDHFYVCFFIYIFYP
jgi:hypothetical protein